MFTCVSLIFLFHNFTINPCRHHRTRAAEKAVLTCKSFFHVYNVICERLSVFTILADL